MRSPTGAARDGVAYVVPRFPKVSETFILHEVVELERAGTSVLLCALQREPGTVHHPDAAALLPRVRFARESLGAVARAQLHWLRRSPRTYASLWARALAGNARSPRFLARALAAVPFGAWFARLVDEAEVGRVHAHYATHSALAGMVAAQLAQVPFTFTAHAHDLYVDTTMLCDKVEAAERVVTISAYNRRLLGELCPGSSTPVDVVRTGADLTTFVALPPPARRDGGLRLACVASLEPYKGLRFLIEAVAILHARGVDVRCEVAGKGELAASLRALAAERGVADRFVLLGPQPKEAVRALLERCDAFVQPSVVTPTGKREGIPVALMEAMACERPVVATDISGVAELVEDGVTGLLVGEQDPEALADALQRLGSDPALRAQLAGAGRARVVADYDLRANARRLQTLLTA